MTFVAKQTGTGMRVDSAANVLTIGCNIER